MAWGRSALYNDQNIGDFKDASLGRLHLVAGARRPYHDPDVGQVGDLDLRLANTHGLDQHHVHARRVHHVDQARRIAREAAQMTARGDRAHKNLRVAGMVQHPDPVAQERAVGKWTRWIDRQHANAKTACPEFADIGRNKRRFAGARRPGYAHHQCLSHPAMGGPQHLGGFAGVVLDRGKGARQGGTIAGEKPVDPWSGRQRGLLRHGCGAA